jgi:hypothetical protein
MLVFAFVLSGGWAAAVLVDDFETYTPGAIATPWVEEVANVAAIEADAGNQYITFGDNAGDWRHVYRPAGSEVSTASTLFFNVYVSADAGLDHAFGMTDEDAPTWYSAYGPYFRITDDTAATAGIASIDVYNTAGTGWVDDQKSLTIGQWYNIWLVMNPTGGTKGTCDVYCNQGNSNATVADLVTSGCGFRKAFATALDVFLMFSGSAAQKNVRVDNVYLLSGQDLSYPLIPVGAHNPTPANGATNILTTSTLSWYTGVDPNNPENVNPDITKHYVYMREGDPNLAYVTPYEVTASGNPTDSTPSPLALLLDKTYYWRVDESVNDSGRADGNTIGGSLWSFETRKSVPQITQEPVSLRKFTTDPNAVFTCVFTSISNATATWYKYVDGVSDTPVTEGVQTDPVDEIYTSTLTITGLVDNDHGNYYCTADNGTAVSSNKAALVIKRLLAQYDFNSSLAPTPYPVSKSDAPTGQGKSVAGLTEPNSLQAADITLAFVDGFDGTPNGAVKLIDPNQYIDFGTTGYPKAGSLLTGIGDGLDTCTILCWVQPNDRAHGLAVVNGYNDDITTGVGFSVEANMDVRINARGEATEILTVQGQSNRPEYDIYDGNWHLIGVRWDASAQSSAVYVDGQWVVADTSMGIPASYAAWQRGLLVGVSRQGTPNRHLLTNFFSGAIDKLRIYNYPLTANEIAKEYYDTAGVKPCINMSFDTNGYNFDNTGSSYCTIDVADLLMFVSEWTDCGLYPLSECPQ